MSNERLDEAKLLEGAQTYATEYRTSVSGIDVTGNSGTPEGAKRDFVRNCERRLTEIEERGRRSQLSLSDVDRLNWLRSKLKGDADEQPS